MSPRIVIPESSICSSLGGPITIDRIEIGEISIPKVRLRDFSGSFTYASSKAKNVEIEMKLSIQSSFTGEVDLPWPIPDMDVSGSINFSTFTEKHSLGDIVMNAGSFSMQSSEVNFGPFSMKPDPIGTKADKTTVGETKVERIDMKCTEIPMDNPLGLNFGSSFPIQNPMEPMNINIRETTMAKLESNRISTPNASARDIKALNIKIPSITTASVEIKSDTNMTVTTSKNLYGSGVSRSGDAKDAKISSTVTLNIKSVKLKIKGGIEFTNLQGTVLTSTANSEKFDMNLKLIGLKIIGLSLCGMKIPEIQVEL